MKNVQKTSLAGLFIVVIIASNGFKLIDTTTSIGLIGVFTSIGLFAAQDNPKKDK
jgi:hypothetical protein